MKIELISSWQQRIKLNSYWQKSLFFIGVTATYVILLFKLNFLQGKFLWDEAGYWETSLIFSKSLLPSISDLRNYNELNTPLPFIVFGILEHLSGEGIFLGRLLNLILSLVIVFFIGYPSSNKHEQKLLCLVGLFICPYFLFYSGRLYTDLIACFLVLMGVIGYFRDRHFWSSIAFILAIASRQYMLAFPLAIFSYEFTLAVNSIIRGDNIRVLEQRRWVFPLIAVLSMLGWVYLFQGLAPEAAFEVQNTPAVQETTWAVTPGGAINFLAFVGFYIVIPEFILFSFSSKLKALQQQRVKIAWIAALLLLYILIFPPLLDSLGTVIKIANFLPSYYLKLAWFYCLSLIACIRFARPKLISLFVLFNTLIMVKAYPWDKYILPLVIVFWYVKSIGMDE